MRRGDTMEEKKRFKDNVLNGRTWLRGLFMLLFVIIYGVTEVILSAVVILQWFFILFTGDLNGQLKRFGQSLAVFVYRVARYWTFNSEAKPFPFEKWPGPEEV